MEAYDHPFQNDAVGLPTPPLDQDFPLFPELDDVTVDDFPFDVDFDFSFDDLSFADDLLHQQPDPINSDVSQDRINPISYDLGDNQTSDDVVRVYDSSSPELKCDPISSADSNFGSSKSNSGDYSGNFCGPDVSSSILLNDCNNKINDSAINLDSSREMIESEQLKTGGQCNSISKCISKSKRKKESEQDHAVEIRKNKYRRSSSNANAVLSDENVELGGNEDDKKMTRLIRNRESAHLSRQRKKQYVEELEDKVKSMASMITDLNTKISYFMAENATLRQQLGGAGVGPPGMYLPPPVAQMPYAWMPYPPAYMVKPHGSHVPLIPIPKWKPQHPTPTPAPKVKKSSSQRRTKKVASVSLIGLFFILLFGGLVPMINVRHGGVEKGSVFMIDKHVERSRHGGDGGFGHGRVLRELNSSNGGNASEPLVASLYVPRNDKLVKIDGNLIIHSVLASDKAVACSTSVGQKTSEETGLAIHGSYPPYPAPGPGSGDWRYPHLDRNHNGRQRALGSGSTDFTPVGSDGKLQQWFREGLAGPMLSSGMCTEVFQFDVSPTPGSVVPAPSVANRNSEDHQNSTRPNKTKNRRILYEHTIPPVDPTFNATEDYMGLHEQSSDGLQSNKTRSSVVVSVLVDPREVGDGDGEGIIRSKTLSRIFVVVLIDSVKYVTYSCMLPFMGSSSSHLLTT